MQSIRKGPETPSHTRTHTTTHTMVQSTRGEPGTIAGKHVSSDVQPNADLRRRCAAAA
jgi:hypothetical protein